MEEKKYYKVYSDYLKERYGEKVYKLPVAIKTTCPNRDGNVGTGGCIFCGEEGGSFENLSCSISVKEQLNKNMEKIRKKYKANKFIAFFQNFTNTYIEFDKFKEYMKDAILEDIVAISVSTRPDCISDEYLSFLFDLSNENSIDIYIELGLQTVNYHSLNKLNRGHGLAEFIDSVLRIKKFGFYTCVHMIPDLPWDDRTDIIEGAKILSAVGIDEIKFHSLYIVKGTELALMYERKEFELLSMEEYITRVRLFLEFISPDIAVQRLIGRAPEENAIHVNWNTSWWKIRDYILLDMEEKESYQGKKFNYLSGKIVEKLNE